MFCFDMNKPDIKELLKKPDVTFEEIIFFDDIQYHLKYEKELIK